MRKNLSSCDCTEIRTHVHTSEGFEVTNWTTGAPVDYVYTQEKATVGTVKYYMIQLDIHHPFFLNIDEWKNETIDNDFIVDCEINYVVVVDLTADHAN